MASFAYALKVVADVLASFTDWDDVVHFDRRLTITDSAHWLLNQDNMSELHPSASARAFMLLVSLAPAHLLSLQRESAVLALQHLSAIL